MSRRRRRRSAQTTRRALEDILNTCDEHRAESAPHDAPHMRGDGTPAGPSRRRFLTATLGTAATGLLLTQCGAGEAAAPASAAAPAHLEVVLLGTRAGPPPDPHRAGIASAVIVDGAVYLVDCGQSALTQYLRAGLALSRLSAIFLTHLHIDHIADYANFFLLGGWAPPGPVGLPDRVPVFGPGSAPSLPPAPPATPTVAPAAPTPGTKALTESSLAATAYSSNLFLRDSGIRDPTSLPDVHEITLPGIAAGVRDTAPTTAPFPVMQDERVRVTATLVSHGPVFPAFAYRFDTAYGSVTFSGDTAPTPNLPSLAHRSDLLVHEAIDVAGFRGPEVLRDHLVTGHTPVDDVGAVAAAAEAGRLVLSHVGSPSGAGIDVASWTARANRGYSGPASVGADLQHIVLR